MEQTKKFQIYYAPHNKEVDSFTLSISRINDKDDTYKLKLIKEIKKDFKIETYKIKEFHIQASCIIAKLNNIDFNKKYDKCQTNQDTYCIKLDDNKILTSHKEQIQYILDLFQFDELYAINIVQYPQIKDVYEFIKLNKLFLHKISNVKNNEKFLSIYDYYLNKNPYKVFENLNNLENFVLT